MSNTSLYFYPNGAKSLSMRSNIRETLRKIQADVQDASFDSRPRHNRRFSQKKTGLRPTQMYFYENTTRGDGRPERTSLIDRPGTAASQTSIMRERGTRLRPPRGLEPLSPSSQPSVSGDDNTVTSGKSQVTGNSVATLDLIRTMKTNNSRLSLGLMQKAPVTSTPPYF
jgi:hypothetical protein